MDSKSGLEPEIPIIAETFKTTADQPSISYTLGPCWQGRNNWQMPKQNFLINN